MTEEQQKELETPTAEQEDAPETVVTNKLDDTPAVAQISDETAETLDTSSKEIHPDTEDEAQTDEAETAEAETAETPEAEATTDAEEAAEAETEEDASVIDKAADALSEAVETVTETVSDAVETATESVSEAVETATAAVTGSDEADEDEAPSASDEDGRLLEQAVDQAVSDLDVPTADESELIIGGERDPITSIEGAQSLDQTHVGYTGEIVGRVVKLEDLDATLEAEETSANYDQLRALIEQTLTDVSEHEIVKGRVVSVGEKDVVIDIGFKSDGVVSKNEFSRDLEAGEEVEVYLERIEDYHGQLVLSKTKADTFRRWERIENAYENEEVLEGTIIRRIKGGMIVELMDGLEAFLPGSQIDVRPVRDFDAYLEKRMEFKIVKINPSNENVVVSHKALIEKELEAQRESILSTMEAGQILEGIVKNITDFGVFIDLGGVDGLLHITDLSWGRVSHPSELVDLDEKMKVVVLDYDKERQRISLGLKQLQPHPWENINDRFSEGD
ncbi:MAG TPA: S1 RNA-binding domain-containing protein, partial [Rhodothermales bacterium]|nr:S1 RNA-binding domain-containing protein [Rhodothermales bacterium]